MADVGVRELKQHLSKYLDRAERGELLRVTERGRPKALLGPLPGERESTGYRRGVDPARVRRSPASGPSLHLEPPGPRCARRRSRRVSLYVDASALLKRYIDEPDSEVAESLLRSDPSLLTGRHTIVEVRRNLARLLAGR